MTLYLKVTADKYELPVAVADSASELANMLGLRRDSMWAVFSKIRKGETRHYKEYKIVEVEDEGDEGTTVDI